MKLPEPPKETNFTMKRMIAVLVGAVIVVGGAGAAWAQVGGGPAKREALRTCARQARQDNPDADKAALREAVRNCMADQGHPPRLSDDQKATAKACVDEAKAANPDADRRTVRAAARPCLEAAGILTPLTPEQQDRRAKLLACFEEAKAAHPGDRPAIRQAVRECVQAA